MGVLQVEVREIHRATPRVELSHVVDELLVFDLHAGPRRHRIVGFRGAAGHDQDRRNHGAPANHGRQVREHDHEGDREAPVHRDVVARGDLSWNALEDEDAEPGQEESERSPLRAACPNPRREKERRQGENETLPGRTPKGGWNVAPLLLSGIGEAGDPAANAVWLLGAVRSSREPRNLDRQMYERNRGGESHSAYGDNGAASQSLAAPASPQLE